MEYRISAWDIEDFLMRLSDDAAQNEDMDAFITLLSRHPKKRIDLDENMRENLIQLYTQQTKVVQVLNLILERESYE